MDKVIVLGSNGMAGHVMSEHLSASGDFSVLGVARTAGTHVRRVLDVLDFSSLREFLSLERPSYVINCVGLLVGAASQNVSEAILTNSYLPHFLSSMGDKLGYRLIHISTDCVFSGNKGGYVEDSVRDGDDNYARTKALGEISSDRHLTIRTSIVGPELTSNGTGLLGWFLRQEGEVPGYSKVYWSGVTTLELAKEVQRLLADDLFGIVHICPEHKISKYELLCLFNRIWSQNCVISPTSTKTVDKSLCNTREDYRYGPISYPVMLEDLKEWMVQHADLYSHYKR